MNSNKNSQETCANLIDKKDRLYEQKEFSSKD